MDKIERGWWENDKVYIHDIDIEKLADKQDEIIDWINKHTKAIRRS